MVEANRSLRDFIAEAMKHFQKRFAVQPTWVSAAPGRVNLIGEHVDYNEGMVLPLAIDRYTVAMACPANVSDGPTSTVISVQQEQTVQVELGQKVDPAAAGWAKHVVGVAAGFNQRGFTIPPIQLLIHSAVPIGAGLSSSAALAVATATLLEQIVETNLAPGDKAALCQQAEHDYAGVPCGIMDPFVSVCAEPDALMLLDCRDLTFKTIPFPSDRVAILIVNSNVKHQLANSEYPLRRQQCINAAKRLSLVSLRDCNVKLLEEQRNALDMVEYKRARHVVSENNRTLAAVEAIRRCEWRDVGRLFYESHRSLRDDFEVSCDELDLLVELAQKIGIAGGVYGCRMTGGGFGGCTVALVQPGKWAAIGDEIVDRYRSATGLNATAERVMPSRGAFAPNVEVNSKCNGE